MAFQLPKAVHFAAFKDGERLPPQDRLGLLARWNVANKCRERVGNMLNLTLADRVAISTACSEENKRTAKVGIVVQLEFTTSRIPSVPNNRGREMNANALESKIVDTLNKLQGAHHSSMEEISDKDSAEYRYHRGAFSALSHAKRIVGETFRDAEQSDDKSLGDIVNDVFGGLGENQ